MEPVISQISAANWPVILLSYSRTGCRNPESKSFNNVALSRAVLESLSPLSTCHALALL